MTTPTRRMLAALLAAGTVSLAAPGVAHAGVSCHRINATGAGQQTGSTTVATIRGGGLLNGTTVGDFPEATPTPTGALIAGTVTFTVNRATLAVAVTGRLDADPTRPPGSITFDVTSTENGMTGTGRLAGAYGTLRLAGAGAPDGSFTETVTGEICVDLSPRS